LMRRVPPRIPAEEAPATASINTFLNIIH
jgi:hypothetical protein